MGVPISAGMQDYVSQGLNSGLVSVIMWCQGNVMSVYMLVAASISWMVGYIADGHGVQHGFAL